MNSIWGNIFQQKREQNETQDLLRGLPLFETLNSRELSALERILYRRTYAADEVLFRRGDPGVGMYIIQNGRVAILFEDRLLAELKDGEFFGEIALLNETPRSATAVARTPCTLLGLFQPDLLGLLERNPRLGVKLLFALAQVTGKRLIAADQQMHDLYEEIGALKAQLTNHRALTGAPPSEGDAVPDPGSAPPEISTAHGPQDATVD